VTTKDYQKVPSIQDPSRHSTNITLKIAVVFKRSRKYTYSRQAEQGELFGMKRVFVIEYSIFGLVCFEGLGDRYCMEHFRIYLTEISTSEVSPMAMVSDSTMESVTDTVVKPLVNSVDPWVTSDTLVDNLSLESTVGGRDVVDGTENTVRLDNGVVSLGQITITDFSSRLLVTSDLISYPIVV